MAVVRSKSKLSRIDLDTRVEHELYRNMPCGDVLRDTCRRRRRNMQREEIKVLSAHDGMLLTKAGIKGSSYRGLSV